ncbi:MAG: sensor histidine kinase [Bacteroidales bacterium]
MKNRILIVLSAVALLVLILVQYVLITETYQTKKEQFDYKYGDLVRTGMRAFDSEEEDFALDSVLYLLDNLAVDYLFASADTMQGSAPEAFYNILVNYRDPDKYLRSFIEAAGESPDFTYHIVLRELNLMDLDFQAQVYPDSVTLPQPPEQALLAGSYTNERNFFRISYEIWINFNNRSRMILHEMWLILCLAILTLLFLFTIFFLTLRNMLLQTRLSEMKTDFINNMTHELKTPLSTISVASSALGERSVIQQQEKVEELSALIKRQNKHLSEMIDRILDIHVWERDEVKLKKAEISTERWIRQLVRGFLLEQRNNAPEINMEFFLSRTTHSFDEVHMSTVLNNLLSNAVRYGHPPVRIRLEAKDDAGFLQLSFADNGPGIPKEELKHIFEKFYRGTESKQRVIRGLGLGLYYVKQIVEAHGGTITVRSIPEKGTTFNIQIPIQHGSITG